MPTPASTRQPWGCRCSGLSRSERALISKFRAAGHQDELYGLLNLEERKRYIGFDRPHVTGERIMVRFSRSCSRQSHQTTSEHRLCLTGVSPQRWRRRHPLAVRQGSDIRTMIHEKLLEMDAGERWVTRPVLAGVNNLQRCLSKKRKWWRHRAKHPHGACRFVRKSPARQCDRATQSP